MHPKTKELITKAVKTVTVPPLTMYFNYLIRSGKYTEAELESMIYEKVEKMRKIG